MEKGATYGKKKCLRLWKICKTDLEREREEDLNAKGAEMKAEQGCTQVWLLSKSLEKG